MAREPSADERRLGTVAGRTGMSIAVAESLTGGELSARFASSPGASEWFRGGIVAYASGVKHDLLSVPVGPVVSEAAAVAMASGACRLLGADVAIAVTGVAGPDEQDGQLAGTVWFALHHDGTSDTHLEQFSGSPPEIVDATCARAVRWVLDHCATRTSVA